MFVSQGSIIQDYTSCKVTKKLQLFDVNYVQNHEHNRHTDLDSPHLTLPPLLISDLFTHHSLQLVVHINTHHQLSLHSVVAHSATQPLRMQLPIPSHVSIAASRSSHMPLKTSCSHATSVLPSPNFPSPFHHTTILPPHNSNLVLLQHSFFHKPNTQIPTLSSHASLREADGVPRTCCKCLCPMKMVGVSPVS